MTLDEAILHAEEKAQGCDACADEHRQLAEWLRELKQKREVIKNLRHFWTCQSPLSSFWKNECTDYFRDRFLKPLINKLHGEE